VRLFERERLSKKISKEIKEMAKLTKAEKAELNNFADDYGYDRELVIKDYLHDKQLQVIKESLNKKLNVKEAVKKIKKHGLVTKEEYAGEEFIKTRSSRMVGTKRYNTTAFFGKTTRPVFWISNIAFAEIKEIIEIFFRNVKTPNIHITMYYNDNDEIEGKVSKSAFNNAKEFNTAMLIVIGNYGDIPIREYEVTFEFRAVGL